MSLPPRQGSDGSVDRMGIGRASIGAHWIGIWIGMGRSGRRRSRGREQAGITMIGERVGGGVGVRRGRAGRMEV